MTTSAEQKQAFVKKLEAVLKAAMLSIREVEFIVHANPVGMPDEFVVITMERGNQRYINVNYNSLLGILIDVVGSLKY